MKRLIITLIVFLPLGLLLNVGVAWTLAMKPPGPIRQIARSQRWLQVAPNRWIQRDLVLERRFGEQRLLESERGYPKPLPNGPLISAPEWMALIPASSDFHGDPWRDVNYAEHPNLPVLYQPAHVYIEYYSGWPMSTLAYRRWEAWFSSGKGPYVQDRDIGVTSAPSIIARHASRHDLPCMPVWPGLVVNSIVYAGVAWLIALDVTTAFRFVRGRLRHRRGLCPTCAYDLRGAAHDQCPECGRPITNPVAA